MLRLRRNQGGVYSERPCSTLDRELGRVEAALEAVLARPTRENMVEHVSRFVTALNAGAIQPTDFAPWQRCYAPLSACAHPPKRGV